MLKYGRRKKSMLPSFPSLRNLSTTSTSSKQRGSNALGSVRGLQISNPIPIPKHSESVDEMVNMLLDETTTALEPDRLTVTQREPFRQEDLPQLPPLTFKVDDAWAQKTTPVVTSAGKINDLEFLDVSESLENSKSQFFGDSVDHSTPPIPRRSSKRVSANQKMVGTEHPTNSQEDPFNSLELSTYTNVPPTGLSQGASINAKIQEMLAATHALKGNNNSQPPQAPPTPRKKHRFMDYKIVDKVRTAINSRLSTRSTKKRRDSIKNDRLLDPNVNESQDQNELRDEQELSQSVNALDLRLNEGENFHAKTSKIYQLTGSGAIPRKPVADDGRSIRSKKSNSTDPFSERPGSSGITRTPTNFDFFLKDDMSIIPDTESIPDLPSNQPQSPRESLTRGKKLKGSPLAHDAESTDAMFSSSPIAQSTPRLRLEPTLTLDGKRLLKNVPADSRSLFDPETSITDIESIPTRKQTNELSPERTKRKTSLTAADGFFLTCPSPKRSKKHPSPSKAELEFYGRQMKLLVRSGFCQTVENLEPSNTREDTSADVGSLLPIPQLLQPKDPNTKLKEPAKPTEKRRGPRHVPKPELPRSGASLPDIARQLTDQKPMIPEPSDVANSNPRQVRRNSMRDDLNSTAMDLDELQWQDSTYDIGTKKKS